jgi:mannose-6-phosphate isomerase-like protein (cupin superfamily)
VKNPFSFNWIAQGGNLGLLYDLTANDTWRGIRIHLQYGRMSGVKSFPYDTRLNILHGGLEVIDEKALSDANKPWFNQTLCQVNASVVRVGVIEGEYHWHKHQNDDEFFYVVDGQLLIDLEGRTVELAPRQGFVVPKGVMHRTRSLVRTVILMVENAGIMPTGD